MNRQEFLRNLKDLKDDVSGQVHFYLKESLEVVKFRQQPREILAPLAEEFNIPLCEDFQYTFGPIFMELLLKVQKQQRILNEHQYPPQSVPELFAISFFPLDLPIMKRHKILDQITTSINQQINDYYKAHKLQIQFLIEEQKRLDQSKQQIQLSEIIQSSQASQASQASQVIQVTQKQVEEPSTEPINKAIESPQPQEKRNNLQLESLARHKVPSDVDLRCDFCICKKLKNQQQQCHQQESIQCVVCRNYYHLSCLNIESTKSIFVCPECLLIRMDPLHEIRKQFMESQVFRPTIVQSQKSYPFQVHGLSKDEVVEVRCLRIDGKSDDISWPDIGELNLNGKRILDFKPLQANSSLKKRKDEKLILSDVTQNSPNIITIKEGQPTVDQKNHCRILQYGTYLFGIFQVQVYTAEQLRMKIYNSKDNWIGIEQSKTLIGLQFMQSSCEDVEMKSIKVSLQCTFDTNMIETPVRGNLCEHIQCMSLENLCVLMKNITPRKWRCPICKMQILDLQIDAYQLAILSIIKQYQINITEITYNVDGDVEQTEIQDKLNAAQLTLLPDYAITNTNRNIGIETLAKKLLRIDNTANLECEIYEAKPKTIRIRTSELVAMKPQKARVCQYNKWGTEVDPIEID